jgi:hypothetical protein
MKEIGGFFELELNKKKEYYSDAIKLNSGRSCLRYIIKSRNPKKIYLPFYSCNSILDIIIEEKIDFEFYYINNNFEPIINNEIKENEFILYINYFGLNNDVAVKLSIEYDNLIVDNTQAFFYKPLRNVDTFYSPRKFFGVPDGGYLYSNSKFNYDLKKDISYDRFKHLLMRIDKSANEAYEFYKENENIIGKQPLKEMSNLTRKLLASISYIEIKRIRENNYKKIHSLLGEYNELEINLNKKLDGPMNYPFLIKSDNLKNKLIENNIYIPTYWKEVLNRTQTDDFENYLTNNLIPLPIDQRYNTEDMKEISELVFQNIF